MKRTALVFLILCLMAGNLFAFAGFDDIFTSDDLAEETKKMSFSVSGSVGATVGAYFDDHVFTEQLLHLNLLADSPSFKSEAALSFDAQKGKLSADTISVTSFFDWGLIKAGLLKEEWGSGDGVHVVDVLNAFDYTKGLSDDIFSMKQAEFMVTSTIYKDQSSLQLYLKPTYKPGLASMDGRWSLFPPAFSGITTLNEPKTDSFDYAQFGARGRTSLGGADLGLLYYKGHMPQPGYSPEPAAPPTYVDLVYTPYQLFGAEATYILGQFTFMAEGGYMLSKDTAGTDPTLYNSKWVYLGGVSYLEPTSQLYVALMYNGHLIVDYDAVKSNATNPLIGFDVDQGQAFDNKAYGNTITLAMEMPLFRERVNVRLGATYQIETEGYALLPSLSWQVSDDLKLVCKAVVYGGSKDSLFKTWKDNDYLSIGITHYF
ncbi:MAG: hypothetical protein RBR15_14750 [Sphaerochaeta sp.]|nr:hypothetical protein [Sphaerochaeta sp.]